MTNLEDTNQELVDVKLIEDIYQILGVSLGEGAVVCEMCGSAILEGDSIQVYAYCPAGVFEWHIGQCACEACTDPRLLSGNWTRGVWELVVSGRVGRCVDEALQSWWPVLLAPNLVAYSPADAVEALDLAPPDDTSIVERETPSTHVSVSDEAADTETDSGEELDEPIDVTYVHPPEPGDGNTSGSPDVAPETNSDQGRVVELPAGNPWHAPEWICAVQSSPLRSQSPAASSVEDDSGSGPDQSDEADATEPSERGDVVDTDEVGGRQTDLYADWTESALEEYPGGEE